MNNETNVWQPKVQDLNSKQGRPSISSNLSRSKIKTPPFTLPSLNYGKPEYLFRSEEFMDDFEDNSPVKRKSIIAKKYFVNILFSKTTTTTATTEKE